MGKPRIAIVGLGVIGTSIGLALRKTQPQFEVVGHDKEMDASRRALKLGAVEKTEWNLISACETADAIVLAAPISAIRQTFEATARYLKQGVVITDTASTKRQVLAWADELLPEHANFVGGDPVLPDGAQRDTPSATLFDKGIYCLCPSVRATPESVEFVSAIVSGFGAQAFFLDATEHDGLVAGSEHLPVLATAALLASTLESPSWREMRKIANVGYEAVVGMLPGTAPAYAGTCLTNAENLTQWLDQYILKLEDVRRFLAGNDEKAINALFETAIAGADKWRSERKRAQWDIGEGAATAPQQQGFIKQAFLGGGFGKRKPSEDKEKKG